MPHLNVSATGCQWRVAGGRSGAIEAAIAALPPTEPVVILIHGYRYRPGDPARDPHQLILSRQTELWSGDLSWPHHLGIRDHQGALAIGFGWDASGSFWRARQEAGRAGLALAALIRRIRSVSPGRRVGILAHSLGGRVLTAALPALEAGDIARAVLMFPALLSGEVRAAASLPSASGTEFIRVTSRENLVFDFLVATLAAGGWDGPVTARVTALLPGWTDLRIDCQRSLTHLARAGFPIAGKSRRICHWSSYMRPGIFALYRALLTAPAPLPVAVLSPPDQAPSWTGETPAEDLPFDPAVS